MYIARGNIAFDEIIFRDTIKYTQKRFSQAQQITKAIESKIDKVTSQFYDLHIIKFYNITYMKTN